MSFPVRIYIAPTVPVWLVVGSKTECDVNAGEVYLENSPGKLPSLEECRQSCEDATACQSITYFNSGWCSHFSTPCTNTKKNSKAVAFRFNRSSSTTSTAKPTVGQYHQNRLFERTTCTAAYKPHTWMYTYEFNQTIAITATTTI